ncbi:MAG: hypothetical protein COB08_010080 [Rhodobacteraceae bacterium]|nr:hypothetical protein [Paracoccaceae bacterium]
MRPSNESLEMQRQRLRDEERTLERNRFIASTAFALVGAIAFGAIFYWLLNYTNILSNLIEKAAP